MYNFVAIILSLIPLLASLALERKRPARLHGLAYSRRLPEARPPGREARTVVAIWNGGDRPLVSQQMAPREHGGFELSPAGECVVETVFTSDSVSTVNVGITGGLQGRIDFDFFEPNEGAVVVVDHDSPSRTVGLRGYVIGGGSIVEIRPSRRAQQRARLIIMTGGALGALFGMTMLYTSDDWVIGYGTLALTFIFSAAGTWRLLKLYQRRSTAPKKIADRFWEEVVRLGGEADFR